MDSKSPPSNLGRPHSRENLRLGQGEKQATITPHENSNHQHRPNQDW
jgi:hypothetical protein